MPEAGSPPPLPLARHVNGLVIGGLLTTLAIPVGSTVAEYEGKVWPNLLTAAAAIAAFLLLAFGLRIGPTKDARRVARDGVPAEAFVERVERLSVIQRQGDDAPAVAQIVLLDLRVEAEGEPVTRVRLRRWVHADKLARLEPGVAVSARVLPGRPQDPALGLRRPG